MKTYKLDGPYAFPSVICCGCTKLCGTNGMGSPETCAIYPKAIPIDIWKGTKMLEEHCDEKGCCPYYEETNDFDEIELDESL